MTGENGEFSFSWGETISFGIDTFELGSVRGNKSTIALTELGDEVRGANIDQLIHRYSTTGQNNTRVVPDDVRKVFAEYPNVINEIINLSLSNGATLDEGEQVVNLPNEFIEQFKTGQAKEIDTAICAKTDGCNEARWFSLTTRNVNDGQIQGVINKLWGVDTNYKSVSKFHVFHDSTNFYGSTGNARGQAVVNISNAAFPILMARNDKNYWLAFGEKRAWDKNELAYITEAPSLVEPENVTRDTATFNLPFISLGQVGEGKLMVIGNPHYNSILRCPNGYSWNGGVNKDGQCTLNSDPDDMKNFMENVLRYLSDDKWTPDAKASMTVGTNLDTVYFKRHGQVTGNSAAFDFHPDFAGISVEHLSSYGDLDPQEMPLLILNGFEYVTQVGNDPYAIPLRADTSKPKLTQQDVTDLIAYLNKGGSVLIMENVMSNLKEESASGFVRLLDAAGLSMALNKSVVNNDPQGYRAELIAESLWEFIDEDRSVQTRLGREDSEYLARSVPFYAANQPLADISEMRVVQGMDAGLYQKLKPLVCALPMTRQQININTLDVTQSVILEALFDPWLSPVQARALLQQRPAKGWEDVDQFLAQPLLADVDERTKKQLKTVLSVDSNYFWLRSDITVNEIELTMNSLIVRMGPQHFSVLWHQTGESE